MKRFLPILLLLTACLAASITTQENLTISDRAQLSVFVADAPVGDALLASIPNERVHIFPGQHPVLLSSQQYYFTIVLEPGACGKTVLTFSAGGADKKVYLTLPDCSTVNPPLPPTQLPVENEFRTFKIQRLDAAEKYLQINQALRDQVSQFQSLVEAAKSTPDFSTRTALADQAMSLLNSLRNVVPYIVDKGGGTAAIGTADLRPKVEAQFGQVATEPSVLIYKQYSIGQAQAGGTTDKPLINDFTLFRIHLYNDGPNTTRVYVVEDQKADNWSEEPAYLGEATIWEVTLTPGEIRKVSYEVNRIMDTSISTQVYRAIEKPKPVPPQYQPEPEMEEEEQPTDLVGQLVSLFGGLEKFLTGLLSLVIR